MILYAMNVLMKWRRNDYQARKESASDWDLVNTQLCVLGCVEGVGQSLVCGRERELAGLLLGVSSGVFERGRAVNDCVEERTNE